MHSSGLRGLCPQCLFACTTGRLATATEPATSDEEEVLFAGATVGPNDRFVLLDRLGHGGMGEVWLASDQALSQEGEPHFVALKFLSKSIRHEPRALAALRAEVLRSQRLSHPNIVRISDLHTTREGMPFINMEFVEGNSLTKWLEDQPQPVMPWRMVTQLTEQLASALLYAHETVGIVHRDIKPSNLLLADGPVVKLSDFGIARVAHAHSRWDQDSVPLGTIWYSSPQQLLGQPPSPADDVYALGATLYELLTGTPPFEAATAEQLTERINNETPEPIPQRLTSLKRQNEVPAKLLIFIQSCLEKDPVYRPKTRELTRFLPPGGVGNLTPRLLVPKTGDWEDSTPSKSGSLAWVWLLVAMLALGAVWWQNWGDVRVRVAALTQSLRETLTASTTTHPNSAEESPPPVTVGPPVTETNTPSPPKSELPPPVSDPSPLTEPVTPPHGRARVTITPDDARQPHGYQLWDAQRRLTASGLLPPSVLEFDSPALDAGEYRLQVTEGAEGRRWMMEEPLVILPNRTNQLTVWFARNAELTVDTDPPDAVVQWPLGLSRSSARTEARTPFTQRFQSGTIWFTARKPGHFEFTTNYAFNPAVSHLLRLELTRSPFPLRGENWTNSLGMVFPWVAPLSNWACATETRVSDFRRFTEATGYDATQGMLSLTVTGFVSTGSSWSNPGFPQTDAHPVVGVSWDDANEFCAWLTRTERARGSLATSQSYRLPSTNEWFALAGGQRFPWGEDARELAGNYSGREVLDSKSPDWPNSWTNSVLTGYRDDHPRTAPVTGAGFLPNAFDLHHVGGNAAEWCQEQVLCGASWFDGHRSDFDCLSTRRVQPARPEERNCRNGFRMVLCQDD